MKTILYRPSDPDGLLSETRSHTLEDSRVVDISTLHAPSTARPYDPEAESAVEYATRAWRLLLPAVGSKDALDLRLTYGWTREDIAQIKELIDACAVELESLVEHVALEDTQVTLLRDGEKLRRLRACWDQILKPRGSEPRAPSL